MAELDFSVIIPAEKFNSYLQENLDGLEKQKGASFEVIVIADDSEKSEKISGYKFEKTILNSSGGPAEKRNLAVKVSKGRWLAFIDDDAYPENNWLEVARKYLAKNEVAAIGGPQLTPPNDGFWQKSSGAMFLSPLSGMAIIRFWPGKKERLVYDWPTVNFFVKKEDFEAVGGFDESFWPGEDTKLCLDIIEKLRKKIFYVPELVVFHHRRAGLKKHLKQTGNYGLHRGFFAKKFPQSSACLADLYFIPSLWVIYLFFGWISFFISSILWKLYLSGIVIYLFAILLSTLVVWWRTKILFVSIFSSFYLMLFHVWYGIRFIQGYVFTKDLKSRLGR